MITNSNLIKLGLQDIKRREYRMPWNHTKYRKAILISNNLYCNIDCDCPRIKYQFPILRIDFSSGDRLDLFIKEISFQTIKKILTILLSGECGEKPKSEFDFRRMLIDVNFRQAMSRR